MKKLLLLLPMLVLVVMLAACANEAEGEAEGIRARTFRLGHNAAEWSTWNHGAVRFAELVYEYSGGLMVIDIFPAAQLGDELEVVRSVQDGIVDFTISGGSLAGFAPLAAMVEVSYLFEDFEHVREAADGPIGQMIADQIIEYALVRPIFYYIRGPRKLTANRPVMSPEELQGMTVRVPASPLSVAAWESMGATVVPMALGEVFTSLQQGVIDAQENPLAMIDAQSFYEVQSHIMNTNHVISFIYVVIGEELYQSLTPEERDIIHRAARQAQDYEHQLMLAEEAYLYRQMEEFGTIFVDVDFDLFREAALPGIIAALDPDQAEIFQMIVDLRN